MLTRLTIKQYALIEELSVDFESGLNIITGETGAGKSIIIDALGLILGERADADAVRKGAEKAVVEGLFAVAGNRKLRALLESHELDTSDELIVRREITAKGQSRAFVNDTPVTLAVLREVGDLMVDLHGQHEHQSLLRSETHIDMVDDFAGLEGLVREFETAYHAVRASQREHRELRSREAQLREKSSLYEFQAAEIDAVAPRAGEEDDLEAELLILENAEKLYAATERLHQMLYEGENAVHDQLVIARNELENLAAIDKAFDEHRAEAASAAAIVDEIAKFVQQYNSRIEFQPGRLDEIRDRLGAIALLKKKYGGSLEAVLAHRETIGRELALAENFDEELSRVATRIDAERDAASAIAVRLSTKRNEAAKKIGAAVVKALAELGIAHGVFETRITYRTADAKEDAVIRVGREWRDATPKGMDVLEFHLSTNIGEDPKPLAKVASGGEVSRVMLAMKMILAKSDRLPLLVFDEIDVGVSGRIAQAVGRSMKKLSQFHQLIAITHMPQIAGLADNHVVVEKIEEKKRSYTRVRKLELEERVAEVAKLLSGDEVTGAGLKSARELMGLRG